MKKLPQPGWHRRSVGDSLDHLEVLIAKLGDGIKADMILFELDEVRARLDAVAAQGKIARGEEAQFDFIGSSLKKKLPDFLKDVGGTTAVIALRSTRQPNSKA